MPKLNVLMILFLFITLGFLAICILVCVLKHRKRNSIDILSVFEADLSQKPIFSISKSPCQGNEKLLIDTFPGTVKGCNCIGKHSRKINTDHRDRITRTQCTVNETKAGCGDIGALGSTEFYTWDSNTFCVNYNEYNYEYYLELSVGEGQECPTGFKKCGILDTLKNVMCMNQSLPCPINSIVINNELTHAEDNIIFNTFKLTDNKYLHYTNEYIKGNIISNLKLSEGGYPCYNPLRYNTILPQYILLKNFKRFICVDEFEKSFYDERYQKLDSITKRQLYEDNNYNNLYNSIIRLPNYPEYSLYSEISLYVRNYFGINKVCFSNEDYKLSSEKIQDFTNDHKTSKNINVGCISVNPVCMVFLAISYSLGINRRLKLKKGFLIFHGINCFILLVSFILAFLNFFYLKDIKFSSTCFDNIMNTFMEKAKNGIHKEKVFCIVCVIFSCLSLLINIALIFIIMGICGSIEENDENNINTDNNYNNNTPENNIKNEKVIEKPKTNDDNMPNVQYVSLGGNVYTNNNGN